MKQKLINKNPRWNAVTFWGIVVFLVLIVMTGCTPAEPVETETPTSTPTETAVPTQTATPLPEFIPTPTEPVTSGVETDDLDGRVVKFAHPWVGEAAQVLEGIAEDFSSTNPWGIRVEVDSHGGETALRGALQADLDAGQMPGLIAAHPYVLSGLDGNFSLVDLGSFIDDPEWGFDPDSLADIDPVFFEPFTFDDGIIALPFAPQATVLFYNSTWGQELGHLEPPRDQNAFRAQSFDAAFVNWRDDNPESDGKGGWKINLDPAVLASWYFAFDGIIPNEGIPSFNNEAGLDTFSYLRDLRIETSIWFPTQPEPYDDFVKRHALLYAGQLDDVPIQMNWMEASDSADEWEVLGFPGVDGELIVVDGPGLLITGGLIEDELAAWLFAKHLLEPEVQVELVQSMFTLPVRISAYDLLEDFLEAYPQWVQGADLLDSARALPVSHGWGVAQWVLQDAGFRLLFSPDPNQPDQVSLILEMLDEMILDMAEASP